MAVFVKSFNYNGTINDDLQFQYIPTDGMSHISLTVFSAANIDVTIIWSLNGVDTDIVETTAIVGGADATHISKPVKSHYVGIQVTYTGPPHAYRQNFFFLKNNLGLVNLDNLGAGAKIYKKSDLGVRSFKSSDASITITEDPYEIDVVANVPNVTMGSTGTVGTVGLVADGIGPQMWLKGLTGMNGTTLSYDSNNVIINTPETTLSSVSAGGQSLVSDGYGPSLSVKGLKPGTNMSFIIDSNDITINNTMFDSTIGSTGTVGSVSLIADGTGPEMWLKGLTGATGISMTYDNNNITVTNTLSSSTLSALSKDIQIGTAPNYELNVGRNLASNLMLCGSTNNYTSSGTGNILMYGLPDNTPCTYTGSNNVHILSNKKDTSFANSDTILIGQSKATGGMNIGIGRCQISGANTVALTPADTNPLGSDCVHIGYLNGYAGSTTGVVSIGSYCGFDSSALGNNSVSLGVEASRYGSGGGAICIGYKCCRNAGGTNSIHIGQNCANDGTSGRLNWGNAMEAVHGSFPVPAANPQAYIKMKWNGTLYYIPAYTSVPV